MFDPLGKISQASCVLNAYANIPPFGQVYRKGTWRTKTRVLCHMQHTATALAQFE